MGHLELYLIYEHDGVWEEAWRPMQGVLDLPAVSKADMDHALNGWTRPLVNQLGPPPAAKLIQLPTEARACAHEKSCPLYDSARCGLLKKKLPWCFAPDGLPAKELVSDVVKLWREEVYVVVVRH